MFSHLRIFQNISQTFYTIDVMPLFWSRIQVEDPMSSKIPPLKSQIYFLFTRKIFRRNIFTSNMPFLSKIHNAYWIQIVLRFQLRGVPSGLQPVHLNWSCLEHKRIRCLGTRSSFWIQGTRPQEGSGNFTLFICKTQIFYRSWWSRPPCLPCFL